MSEQTEEEYLIERLSKLLAEISVIVNGPQPMGVLWGYADLPEKVQALKDAALNHQAGVVEALRPLEKALAEYDKPSGGLDELYDVKDAARAALAAIKGVES